MACLACEERARLMKAAFAAARVGDLPTARTKIVDTLKTVADDLTRRGIVVRKQTSTETTEE